MQKYNYKLISELKKFDCNETEINIVNLITRYQSDAGIVNNFTYKFALENLNISKQHFYKNLWKLSDKGIIKILPTSSNGYFDIQIPLNDYFTCRDKDQFYKDNPYFSTNVFNIIYSNFFKNASKNLMYLILTLIKLLNQNTKARSRKLSIEKLKEYSKTTSKRTIKKYLEYLQTFFFIRENNKSKTVIIGIRELKKDKYTENERRVWYRLKSWLDKEKIKYNSHQLKNTVDLFVINGYEEKFGGLLHKVLIDTCYAHGMLKHRLINKTISIIANKNQLYYRDEITTGIPF